MVFSALHWWMIASQAQTETWSIQPCTCWWGSKSVWRNSASITTSSLFLRILQRLSCPQKWAFRDILGTVLLHSRRPGYSDGQTNFGLSTHFNRKSVLQVGPTVLVHPVPPDYTTEKFNFFLAITCASTELNPSRVSLLRFHVFEHSVWF